MLTTFEDNGLRHSSCRKIHKEGKPQRMVVQLWAQKDVDNEEKQGRQGR